jgi:hypothetical protein
MRKATRLGRHAPARSVQCCGPIQTVSRHEAPPWLLSNPYIVAGYRKQLTWLECILSMFQIHNGTEPCLHLSSARNVQHLDPLVSLAYFLWYVLQELGLSSLTRQGALLYCLFFVIEDHTLFDKVTFIEPTKFT